MAESEEQITQLPRTAQRELPFSGEFSPNQVDLVWLLETASVATDRVTFVEAVRAKYYSNSCERYSDPVKRLKEQTKRAGNVPIGMAKFELMSTKPFGLSDFGRSLLAKKDDPAEVHRQFAAHIISALHGNDVLIAIDNLRTRHEAVDKHSLAQELRKMGYYLPTATTKHLLLLAWLRKAGLLDAAGYDYDDQKLAAVLGSTPTVLSDIDALGDDPRKFLRGLAKLAPIGTWLSVSEAVRYADALYRLTIPEDRWQDRLLKPLQDAGWIELERGTEGRGAKSGKLRGTLRLESIWVQKLVDQEAPAIPPELRKARNRPLDEILAELKSDDKHVKGIALELLALKLTELLDLTPKKLRERSSRTGGAEVDLIVEAARLIFTRWQIQCKNTASVHLNDLAKEVGLAVLLKSQVVMLVTTGKIGRAVRVHAKEVNQGTALQVILLDGSDLQRMAKRHESAGYQLVKLLDEQAEQAMAQKSAQVIDESEE